MIVPGSQRMTQGPQGCVCRWAAIAEAAASTPRHRALGPGDDAVTGASWKEQFDDWRSAWLKCDGNRRCTLVISHEALAAQLDRGVRRHSTGAPRGGDPLQDCGSNWKTRSSWLQRQAFAMRAAHA